MIKIRNYVTNTLRKQRTQAFEKDLKQVFDIFEDIRTPHHRVSIFQFNDIWEKCHMQFIFQCVSEEEDEDEFAQHLYEIIFKRYLLNRPKVQKIFALFTLYCAYFACERRKKICISKLYLEEIIAFMKVNPNEAGCDYMKVVRYLHENCFLYSTKVGIRNAILKANGQPVKKAPIVWTDPLEFISTLKDDMKDVKKILQDYQNQKQQAKNMGAKTQKIGSVDVYFSHRVEQLIRQYQRQVQIPQQS